jgi:hypothetical protein
MLHSALTILLLLCNSRKITIDYSVYNTNTAIVPAATPIAIYANGLLIGYEDPKHHSN